MNFSKHQRYLARKKKHLCIDCGKPAEPRNEKGYYSRCAECRARATGETETPQEKARKGKMTLCWYCKNAIPDDKGDKGCSWSRNRLPVDGWEAKLTQLKVAKRLTMPSYQVIECPEFKEGR